MLIQTLRKGIIVEIVFTEIDAVVSESVEETKRSPKKKHIQRWESNGGVVQTPDTIDTVEVVESGGDIVLSDEVDLMVARLWALEEELGVVKTRNSDLEETVTTLTASLAESTLQNNLLYTEVETLTGKVKTLTGELDATQVALTKRRGDLRI